MHRERTDAELVAELHRHGGPLTGRQVMRLLGVGTPKATRLVRLAGWASPEPEMGTSDPTPHTARPLQIVTESKTHQPQTDDTDDKDDNMSSSPTGSTP